MRKSVPFDLRITNLEPVYTTLVTQQGMEDLDQARGKPILELARRNGWVPAGTLPPKGVPVAEWSGDYFPGKGQRIIAKDAQGLAEGIRRALPSIPDRRWHPGDPVPFQADDDYDMVDIFLLLASGASKQSLARLADWIGAGEVQIGGVPGPQTPDRLRFAEGR